MPANPGRSNMLDKFRIAKQPEIERLRTLQTQGKLPAAFTGRRPSFSAALTQSPSIAVITEYKRASPSKGVINLNFGPEEIAACYAGAGASALSVLTEETYFQGELGYLERMTAPGLPLLRKDFLLDPLQVVQTAATPASALLLIVRMFDSARVLGSMIGLAAELGLESVVEIFGESELETAREAGAQIIQVNNRDLDSLKTDLRTSERLAAKRNKDSFAEEIWISASGIQNSNNLRQMEDLGYQAALVGTFLMQGAAPDIALRHLIEG